MDEKPLVRERYLWPFLVLYYAVFVWVLITVGQRAKGAPAPAPKRVAPVVIFPASLPGQWHLVWGEGEGDCHIYPSGEWACRWMGGDWSGTWTREGETLTVDEVLIDAQTGARLAECHWRAKLKPGTRAGELVDGGTFRLTPRKLPRPDA